MVSFLLHAVVGVACVAWFLRANAPFLARPADGPGLTATEALWWTTGLASWAVGYWFNLHFILDAGPAGNPFVGPGSWSDFTASLFTNPAASSISQDLICTNVVVLPLLTILDGRRRGIRRAPLAFVISLFTSCTFGFCVYLAVRERQQRHMAAPLPTSGDRVPA